MRRLEPGKTWEYLPTEVEEPFTQECGFFTLLLRKTMEHSSQSPELKGTQSQGELRRPRPCPIPLQPLTILTQAFIGPETSVCVGRS